MTQDTQVEAYDGHNVVAHEGPDNLEVYRGTTENLIWGQNFDLNGTPLSEDEGAMTPELVARLRTIQPGDVIQCGDGYHSDFRVSLACCKPMCNLSCGLLSQVS